MIAFLQIAQRSHPEWFVLHMTPLTPVGIPLWFAGMVLTAYAVWHLRHAFSIEPAARRLVTSGPYGFARHPIYTGYFVQYLGMLITFPSWPLGLALLVWTAPMIDRMYLEEAVLRAAFPGTPPTSAASVRLVRCRSVALRGSLTSPASDIVLSQRPVTAAARSSRPCS